LMKPVSSNTFHDGDRPVLLSSVESAITIMKGAM